MNPQHYRVPSGWPLAGLLLLVAAAVGVLLLGVAGDRKGMQILPGPENVRVEWLTDEVARLGREEAMARPDAEWRDWAGPGYLRSYRGEALWVRMTFRNESGQARRGVLADAEYYTDEIELWVEDPQAPEGWRLSRSGERTPAAQKALWGRDSAFFIEVPAGGETRVVMRVADHFGAWLRLAWWPDERRFFAAQLRDTAAEAIYFGLLLALLVYNGVLWARLRFHDLGYYLGYLTSIACFMFFSRCLHQVLGLGWGSPTMETIVTVSLGTSVAFVAQFARVFLDLHKITPRCDLLARGLRALGIALAIGGLSFPWVNATIWMHFAVGGAALAHLGLFFVALVAWRAGQTQARYFVLSFGFLSAGAIPTAAIWLLAIPLGQSAMAMMTGSALEMLLLSLALADRFAVLQREKLEAQARAVEEAEQRRAIQEAYADELEVEVRERTRELQAANADKDRMLAVVGHDLRSPLTGLTRAAEQAAAKREPGGDFAGEAARTGRALLLLIEDLVLWARLRAGSVHRGRHAAAALVAPAVAQHRALAARLELVVDVPEGLQVETDLVLAQTLVRNLLANALKHARSRVELRVAPAADGVVRFAVRDDGPGLPPAVRAALEGRGEWPADAGLGLRLCGEIGRALRTGLEADRPAGGGTELAFVLAGLREEVAA
jgi:signal transduction histidine kinase